MIRLIRERAAGVLELKSAGRRGPRLSERSDGLAIHLQVISLGLLDLVPLVEQLARTVVLAGVFADLHHQVLLRQLLLPLRRAGERLLLPELPSTTLRTTI